MNKLLKLFPFLSSNRFWAAFAMALAILLSKYGLIPVELSDFIMTLGGIHIGVRTIDRNFGPVEKKK